MTVEADTDAVITWDFDTVLGELDFSLLYRYVRSSFLDAASTCCFARNLFCWMF